MAQTIDTLWGGQVTTAALNNRFTDALGGKNTVLYGMTVVPTSPSSNSVNINAGACVISGVRIVESAQVVTGLTFAANSQTNPRIDVLYAQYTHGVGNTTATYGILQGTAAANPTAPAVGANQVALAYVTIPANMTTVLVTADMIGVPTYRSLDAALSTLADMSHMMFNMPDGDATYGLTGWFSGWALTGAGLTVNMAAGFGIDNTGRWLKTTAVTVIPVPANVTNYIVFSVKQQRFTYSSTKTDGIWVGTFTSNGTGVTSVTTTPMSPWPVNVQKLGGYTSSDLLLTAGTGLSKSGTTLNVAPTTTTTLGGVIVGTNLTVDANGKVSADVGLGVNTYTGKQKATQFESSAAQGTAPLIVGSTTQVTNLNASLVGGYAAGNLDGNVPVSNGTVNTNLNADKLDGNHASAFGQLSATQTWSGTNTFSGGLVSDREGIYGTYNMQQVQGIWSIGAAYPIDQTNNNGGSQYGLMYSYGGSGGVAQGDKTAKLSDHAINVVSGGTIGIAFGMAGSAWFRGDINAAHVYSAVFNDYAEWFEKGDETLEPGDVVVKQRGSKKYLKSSVEGDKLAVGVVSDSYGHILGGENLPNMADNAEKFVPVGLSGRLKVKVTGPVYEGDTLISSSVPGHAMAGYIPGAVIGKALEDNIDGEGKILMLIMNC